MLSRLEKRWRGSVMRGKMGVVGKRIENIYSAPNASFPFLFFVMPFYVTVFPAPLRSSLSPMEPWFRHVLLQSRLHSTFTKSNTVSIIIISRSLAVSWTSPDSLFLVAALAFLRSPIRPVLAGALHNQNERLDSCSHRTPQLALSRLCCETSSNPPLSSPVDETGLGVGRADHP